MRDENNERLGSNCLSLIKMTTGIPIYLKIDRPAYSLVLFQSMFGCVTDKQYDRLSDLMISFGTAKNLTTFYRRKYWNTKYINYFYL